MADEVKTCSELAWRGEYGNMTLRRCGKPSKFEVEGKPFCGIHNPERAAKVAADSRWKAQLAKRRMENAAEDLYDALYALAVDAGDDTDPLPKAFIALNKARA